MKLKSVLIYLNLGVLDTAYILNICTVHKVHILKRGISPGKV